MNPLVQKGTQLLLHGSIFQRIIDDRFDIPQFIPGVKPFSGEAVCVDILFPDQVPDSIGELDLATAAPGCLFQARKDRRGEDVSSDGPKMRGCCLRAWFLDNIFEQEEVRSEFLTPDNPVFTEVFDRHVLDCDHG